MPRNCPINRPDWGNSQTFSFKFILNRNGSYLSVLLVFERFPESNNLILLFCRNLIRRMLRCLRVIFIPLRFIPVCFITTNPQVNPLTAFAQCLSYVCDFFFCLITPNGFLSLLILLHYCFCNEYPLYMSKNYIFCILCYATLQCVSYVMLFIT